MFVKRNSRFVILILLSLFTYFCAKHEPFESSNESSNSNECAFGSEGTLEVMTWNLEDFPLTSNTVKYVSSIIKMLDIDIIALQEIKSNSAFESMIDSLGNWTGYRADSAGYDINLAFLYKKELEFKGIYEIYQDEWYAFPRSPLVLRVEFNNQDVFVIDNHFKAMGDSESEDRRRQASHLLEEYINNNLNDENVIVVGDFNDEIQEPADENVFQNFIDNSANFMFADMEIAEGSSGFWSYPSYPSHLDHILITNELFDEYESTSCEIKVFNPNNYISNSQTNISDHRPVAIKLQIN